LCIYELCKNVTHLVLDPLIFFTLLYKISPQLRWTSVEEYDFFWAHFRPYSWTAINSVRTGSTLLNQQFSTVCESRSHPLPRSLRKEAEQTITHFSYKSLVY
jgi:hypothetical protein